jgi:hypothetical protein
MATPNAPNPICTAFSAATRSVVVVGHARFGAGAGTALAVDVDGGDGSVGATATSTKLHQTQFAPRFRAPNGTCVQLHHYQQKSRPPLSWSPRTTAADEGDFLELYSTILFYSSDGE